MSGSAIHEVQWRFVKYPAWLLFSCLKLALTWS